MCAVHIIIIYIITLYLLLCNGSADVSISQDIVMYLYTSSDYVVTSIENLYM